MSFKSKQQGLNLIELMAVLAVAGIVLGAGIPALTSTLARYNVKAEANRIVASINFARSQAVNKQQEVTLAKKSSSIADWSEGWTIFVDADGNGNQAFDGTSDTLLKDLTPNPSGLSLQANIAGQSYISFDSNGRLDKNGLIVKVAVCNDDITDGIEGTLVSINSVGRPSLSTISATDKSAQCAP